MSDNQFGLPDITFAYKDPELIKAQLAARFKDKSGRELAAADPIMTIFNVITAELVGLRSTIDFTGKQNLLAYSRDSYLDHKNKDFDLERFQAVKAAATIRFTLNQLQKEDVVIPAGTKVNADSKVYFMVQEDTTVKLGLSYIDITCLATIGGEIGNNYLPGTIVTQFNPLPFIGGVLNLDMSAGGVNRESDESFRERRLVAPHALSTAGPDKGYEYWARTASSSIIDVEPYSPTPGVVQIIPLMTDGRFPTGAELDLITKACRPDDRRPLTDKVESVTPVAADYEIKLTYWISSKAEIDTPQIQANVTAAIDKFIYLTKTKLGRAINPSVLENMIMAAGARRVSIEKPGQKELTSLQVGNNTNCDVTYGGIEKDY